MTDYVGIHFPEGTVLVHYGIKGMRWGVRKDGKPQGFQYGEKAKKSLVRVKKRAKTNRERTRANRNRSQLSEAELDKRIARLRKERELRQLTDSEVRPGRAYVRDFIKTNGGKVASAVAVGVGMYAAKRYLTNQGYKLPKNVQGPVRKDPWDWAKAAEMVRLKK